ncbi:MAG: ABC transporter permease [bacterium]|nr:ABC transporter permease [bacterium]
MTPLLRRASLHHLVRHPWLIGLSVLGVAVAVAVVVGIDLANSSARRAFDLSVEGVAGRATHEIVGGPAGLDEALYARLRTDLGLRDSTPIIEAVVSSADSSRTFQLLGIDIFVDQTLRSFTPSYSRAGTATAFLTRPGTTYLGESLAAELGLGAGDRLSIRAEGGTHSLEILGLLSPGDADDLARQALRDLLIVDLATAQELLALQGRLTRIDVVLPDGSRHEEELRHTLPPGAELARKSARAGALDQMTRAFRLNLTALSLLALVVGMFLIYNTLTFSVVQRRPLLGTLRALGVTRRQVFGLVIAEAALVGLVGTALGLAGGILLAEGLLRLVVRTINDLYFALSVSSVEIPWIGLAKGAALGVGGTVLAALRPAREATTATPRAVLTRSALEGQALRGLPRTAGAGVVLILAAGLLLALPTKSLLVSFGALFLFVLGFAALVPAATLAATRALQAPMRRLFGVLGAMAVRGVATTLSRTGVAIAALVIAVSVTIGVGVMVASFRSTLIGWLGTTLAADIYVAPADPRSRGGATALDREVLEQIESAPEVAFATTYRRVRVRSSLGPVDLGALRAERPAFDAFDFARGRPEEVWRKFQAGAMIVSEPLAYHHDLDLGSTVELVTDRGRRSFEIAGIYYDYGSDRGVVTLGRETYDRFWSDREIFSIGIFLKDPESTDREEQLASLRALVGERENVRWIANRELREASLEIFDRTFVITDVLRLLAVSVAFIGVLSALMALQLERGRELGVLRANGLTPRQVWGLVSAQCGLMGSVAGLLALPLGIALAVLLIHIINRRSFGWTLHMELPPHILLQAVLLSLVAALLAGIYPAFKLSRSSPARALREE